MEQVAKPDIYLDIDGVLWLTTHCKNGVNNTLSPLKEAFGEALAAELFEKVKATD